MLIQLDEDELAALVNCIAETLEALEESELQTRTGWEKSELLQLMQKLKSTASAG